jgi:hypothetical protein
VFDPNRPANNGGFQIMNALGANHPAGQNAMNIISNGPMGALSGQEDAFRQAMTDWRTGRPVREGIDPAAYRASLMDWRGQRPNRHGFIPPVGGPVQTLPAPAGPPAHAGPPPHVPGAANFPGMVGQSLGVQGLTPGASPFDLPTY